MTAGGYNRRASHAYVCGGSMPPTPTLRYGGGGYEEIGELRTPAKWVTPGSTLAIRMYAPLRYS